MVALSDFECLPLEIIRNIVFFCGDDEAVLILPQVSKRLYDACNDRELLRNVFQKELEHLIYSIGDDGRNEQQYISLYGTKYDMLQSIRSGKVIDRGSRSYLSGPKYWSRWIIALRTMQSASCTWSTSDVSKFVGLMQYLPHVFLLGVPLPCSETKRKWLVELFAFYYLDVTGPPAFRSRYYSPEIDIQELNLRMALCLTVLVSRHENTPQLFEKVEILCDQSIASWLASAMLGSRDYLWSKNYNEPPHTKRSIIPQVEALSTIMGLAASLLHHHQAEEVTLPDTAKLPLFANPDMSKYPLPFDLLARPMDTKSLSNPRSFKDMISAQQKEFLDTNLISRGNWCGYYLLERPHDLAEFVFSPLLEGIQFYSTRIATDEWKVISNVFSDGRNCQFYGSMKGDEHFCEVIVDRVMDNTTEHWHGQLSAFGISGGFSVHHESGVVFPGGLFWLWKESWASLQSASSNETTSDIA